MEKQSLTAFLEQTYARYHRPEYLVSDPLEFPHRFQDPLDVECVAVFSALLAYGNVVQIRASVERWLERLQALGLRPSEWVQLPRPRDRREALRGVYHRFQTAEHLDLLGQLVGRSHREHGAVGAHVGSGSGSLEAKWSAFIREWKMWAAEVDEKTAQSRGFLHLLSDPQDGSACKRGCMLLRWMVRGPDPIDLGLWRQINAAELFMPLDTHTSRIAASLGLTQRKSVDWRTVREVSEALARIDPNDPIRFDFSLCRIGILREASHG